MGSPVSRKSIYWAIVVTITTVGYGDIVALRHILGKSFGLAHSMLCQATPFLPSQPVLLTAELNKEMNAPTNLG